MFERKEKYIHKNKFFFLQKRGDVETSVTSVTPRVRPGARRYENSCYVLARF